MERVHTKPRGQLQISRLLTALAFSMSSLVGCGFVYDHKIDGPYRLVAVDILEDMTVCYDLGSDCIGRIDQTVFAVGWNADYVVAARHPHAFADETYDTSRTEYFYIVRALDGPLVDPSVCVRGPLTAAEFTLEQERLSLPPLSMTVGSLQ